MQFGAWKKRFAKKAPLPAGAKALAVKVPDGDLRSDGKRKKGKATHVEPLAPPLPGSPSRQEIVILGWQPKRLNELLGVYHYAASKMKFEDATRLSKELREAGFVAAAGRRMVSIVIIKGPRQRSGDTDAYWKSLLDGLERCGAIRGDTMRWIRPVREDDERGPVKGIRITLEDM